MSDFSSLSAADYIVAATAAIVAASGTLAQLATAIREIKAAWRKFIDALGA